MLPQMGRPPICDRRSGAVASRFDALEPRIFSLCARPSYDAANVVQESVSAVLEQYAGRAPVPLNGDSKPRTRNDTPLVF